LVHAPAPAFRDQPSADDEQATVLFQGDLGGYRVDLVLIVAHADERGVQHQTGRLLGGALARGGRPALGPTSQGYIQIVDFPERTRSGRVPGSEKGGFELLAVSLPMPRVQHYGIATA
jgi:hypothetical protein